MLFNRKRVKKIICFAFLLFLCLTLDVHATEVHLDNTRDNAYIYGKLVNETYDKIILDSDINVSCFSEQYAINSISNSSKTLDLNGYKMSLGCPLLLNGYNNNGIINIIDSSEEKTGQLLNNILVRNCFDGSCNTMTVNITGGLYNASTFIEFKEDYANNLNLNINNINFVGNTLFKGFSNNVNIKNSIFKPSDNNFKILDDESVVLLSDIIDENYKVVGNNDLITMTTQANDINIKNSNVYIAKNTDFIEINDFETKDKWYSQLNANYISFNNSTDEDIKIKSIEIDNNTDFELNGTGELTVLSGSKITTDYNITVKDGLSVGKHNTNVIVRDENDNLYVETITFVVENKKISKPTLTSLTTFEYDEREHEIIFSGFDESAMELTGTTKSNQVGEYTATISLKEGYCWEDGTSDDIIYNWEIILVNQIDDLKIIGSNFINVNKQSQFQVIVLPDDASYKEVTWSVENGTGEANIDKNGLLTAVKEGTVKVRVTANYNNSIFTEKDIVINSEHSIERIMITAPSYYISGDSTHKLFASVYPTNIESKQFFWTSLDTSVATIDQNGLLTPIKEGTATIKATATDGSGVYSEIELVIYNPTNTFTGIVGTTTKIEYSYTHGSHKVSSRDTSIATISGYSCDTSNYPYQCYANVYAVKPGSVTISAYPLFGTSSDLDHNFTFLSYSAHTNINSSYSEIILEQDDIFLLDIDSLYEEDTKELYFTSSNDSVASIDSSGRIVAHNVGNSNITIFSKYNNQKLIIPLSVVQDKNNYTILTEKIEIDGESENLRVGNNFSYIANVYPLNVSNKEITWSVENQTGKASITNEGVLTAESAGTVKIIATANDGSDVIGEKNITLMDYYDVKSIVIKANSLYVSTNTSMYLKAYVYPQNATIKDVIWKSSDTSIATIDENTGGLSTKYKTGVVTITATAKDGTGIVGSIQLYVGYASIKVGETLSFGNSNYITHDTVLWEVEDETIVKPTGQTGSTSVNGYYKHYIYLEGLKNGETTLTMKTISGDTIASSKIYVYTAVNEIVVNDSNISVGVGDTKKINVSVNPEDVSENLSKLIYTSDDNSIAKIDENGNIYGLKAGKTNIYVYSQYNNITKTIPIEVLVLATDLKLNSTNVNLTPNNLTHQIEHEIYPTDTTYKKVTYSSSNEDIAAVNEQGLITGLKNGTATITITTEDGSISKDISVVISGITKNIANLKFSNISEQLYTSEEIKPIVTIYDNNYELINGVDFNVLYENNINEGTATVKIEGINDYYGNKNIDFVIKKAVIEYSSLGKTVVYDGKSYGISLNVVTEGVTIKYANENGEYVLDTMPQYSDAGNYDIKYMLTKKNYTTVKSSNLLTIEKANIEYSFTEREDYFDSYPSNLGYGNFSDLWIWVSNPNKDYNIKYQDKNGNYTLDVADVPTKAGDMLINFQISAKNYNTVQSSMYRHSYGILNMHNSLRLTEWYLRVKDYTTDFNKLLEKFNVYSTSQYSFRYEHRDANNNVLVNSPIKTGDRFVMLFSGDLIFHDWYISLLGDVNCDGKISALDYVKIKNHIMQTNYINSSWAMDAADLNEDGKISALDYVRVKNYIMNGGK